MRSDKGFISKTKTMSREEIEKYLGKSNIDYWFHEVLTYPRDIQKSEDESNSKLVLVNIN